jgi:esterase/lipase
MRNTSRSFSVSTPALIGLLPLLTTYPAKAIHHPSLQTCSQTETSDSYLLRLHSRERERGSTITTQVEYLSHSSNPKGVVTFLHGLNNKPQIFDSLNSDLLKVGWITITGVLTGHGGDVEAFKQVKPSQWIQDTLEIKCLSQSISSEKKLKSYFIGYSLGGLVMADVLWHPDHQVNPFQNALFLAPAWQTRLPSHWLKSLSSFAPWMGPLLIPSLNHPSLTAHWATPLSAYQSLALLTDRRKNWVPSKVSQAKFLVAIDPEDELVDASAIKKITSANPQSEFLEVSTSQSTFEKPKHHLIFSQEVLGPDWTKIQFVIQKSFF